MSIMKWLRTRDSRVAKQRAEQEKAFNDEQVAEAIKLLKELATPEQVLDLATFVLTREQTGDAVGNYSRSWCKKAREIVENLRSQNMKRRKSNAKRNRVGALASSA